MTDKNYIGECEKRRRSVENAMAIMLTSSKGPDELFMKVLDEYIMGGITLEEMEKKIDRFEYLDV